MVVEIFLGVFGNRFIRPLVGVQVLQYCVPLYVRNDLMRVATKAAPSTLVRARKAWGPNELTYPKRENVRIGLKGKKIFLPQF